MGGSAIAADLARSLFHAETEEPFLLTRGPQLPQAVGPRSTVFLLSYSGETWETLAAYDDAGRRGAQRIAISSGGTLAQRAEHDSVPFLLVPPGSPPRFAAGYMLGGLLGVLDPAFPESIQPRLNRAASSLEERIGSFLDGGSLPARWARNVGHRIPFIYSDPEFVPLARRWKTQVEENAKRLAVCDEYPEILHNSIVGWDAIPRRLARELCVVLLAGTASARAHGPRIDHFADLLQRRGVKVQPVSLEFDDRLEALIVGLSLGDFFSLALAEYAGVDPYPIDAISRLKRASRSSRTARPGPT